MGIPICSSIEFPISGREVVVFQRFNRSHVIRPGRFMWIRNGTFETASSPALTFRAKPDAVYYPADRRLIFANFRNANTILPLADC